MTLHRKLIVICVLFGGYISAHAQQLPFEQHNDGASYRSVLDSYCVTCHNKQLRTAGLMLDELDVENINQAPDLWEKVIRKLRAGQMPPSGMPRPEPQTLDAMAAYLETELDTLALEAPNAGRRGAVHRLNRAEYANSIRDLLAVQIDEESLLPADDSGGGFDNIADILSVSPLLMERYMSAARHISRVSIGDPSIGADTKTYELSEFFRQEDRVSEDLPFGSHGGMAISHRFPLSGEYVITIRLQRTEYLYVRGIAEPHLIDVRMDGSRLKLFKIGGEHIGMADGIQAADTNPPDINQAAYERTTDGGLEIRIPVEAGTHLIGVTFLQEFFASENLRNESDIGVSNITITGPNKVVGSGNTASRQKVFVCTPSGKDDAESCARTILSGLARAAYRRPVVESDLDELMSFYRSASKQRGFESGIQMALRRILISPEFLFRIERDPPGIKPDTNYKISDIELASRLSFFLWSSIPDDELLSIAEAGKLSEPEVLKQQVVRMLVDSRSKALVENFAGQWLYLRNIKTINPSKDVFAEFDENLRLAFRQETELFFESMLQEDRSVLDLLRADYTYLNQRLAEHYDIPGIYGNRFRKVSLANENRHGLLGQGSFLTVTSIANRTSTVLRGKWVLENLLGTPPPEPPADVPALKEKGAGGAALTMRQQMEQHQASPVCATCHKLMDPIGFALENFDGIGQWRDNEAGLPIDPSGVLPDGTSIQGVADLRWAILNRPEQLVNTVTIKLLTYALGRGLEYYDAAAIRNILRDARDDDYRWSTIIHGIVSTIPFQMRRSAEL
ncbi:MAG: mono/diheme cytochrome c family protein [Gammaproteobacteria bacterium]